MKTILNIKTEKSLKEEAQETARELGLPLSTVVNAFLKQFIRDKEVTFSSSYKPSKYLEDILIKAEQDIKTGKNIHTFNSTEEMDKLLDSTK